MNRVTGILLDETGDIMVKNGSMVIDDSTRQNQYLILVAQKGEYKEYPTFGVGISDMLGDDDVLEWKKRIREELTKDDLKVNKIDLNLQTGEIEIEAKYNK
ncbi:MAG: hypothetical protein LBI45_02140 [Bacteroidales bacterium]|jgi:hypothetical protein|nr:hypothetical protein [Bacteroidales bacterium]